MIVRHENTWRMAKSATVNPRLIDQEALIKLLIDGVHREGPIQRAKKWNDWDVTAKFARKFGAQAARYVSDAAEIHRRIEQAEHTAQHIRERAEEDAKVFRERAESEAPAKWLELISILGLEADASRWDIERELRELRTAKEGTAEARTLRSILTALGRIVKQNEHFLEVAEGTVTPKRSAGLVRETPLPENNGSLFEQITDIGTDETD